jgi:hypothetical protein
MTERSAVRLIALAALAASAWADSPEIIISYGIDFVTVGDAGNRVSTLADTASQIELFHTSRGGADHTSAVRCGARDAATRSVARERRSC